MRKHKKKRKEVIRWYHFTFLGVMFVISIYFAISDAQKAEKAYLKEEEIRTNISTEAVEKAVKSRNFEATEASKQCTVSEQEQTEIESSETETETEVEIIETKQIDDTPYYCYKNRDFLDHSLQYHLWELWKRFEMPEDWYVYMIGLIYQECSFTPNPHYNADGSVDIGYFQYNNKWFFDKAVKVGHPELDINNKYHQAFLFVLETRNRMLQGFSIEECISKHRTGDYDAYNPEYVALVKERTDALRNE